MLKKPLKEEQADMQARWSDPSYRWANDSALRNRYLKESNAKTKISTPRHDVEATQHSAGASIEEGARGKGEE